LLAAVASTLFMVLLGSVAPNLKELTLSVVVATVLSSSLFWWLMIVHPRRVTVVRGALAGLFSVILALFLMWIVWWITSGAIFGQGDLLEKLLKALAFGLLVAIATCISPLGWFLMAVGAGIGASLSVFTQNWALLKITDEDSPGSPDGGEFR